jgi:hypothetical protein
MQARLQNALLIAIKLIGYRLNLIFTLFYKCMIHVCSIFCMSQFDRRRHIGYVDVVGGTDFHLDVTRQAAIRFE